MKSLRLSPFIFLFLALLLVGAGAFLQESVHRQLVEAPGKEIAQEITTNVQASIAKGRAQLRNIVSDLPPDSSTFSRILPKTTIPVFVFQRNSLVFWSDHTLQPEISPSAVRQPVQLVENRFGRYLVVREQAGVQYTLFAVFPLETRYGINNAYLKNGLNPAYFDNHEVLIQAERSAGAYPVLDRDGSFLFSVSVLESSDWLHAGPLTLALYVLAIFFWLCFLRAAWTRYTSITGSSQIWALWLVILGLLVPRGLMLLMGFPNNVHEITLFSPRVYAAGWWSPSLGDLLLNELVLLTITLVVYKLGRTIRFQADFWKTDQKRRLVLGVVLSATLVLLLISWYEFYRSLIINTQVSLDITQSVQLGLEKLLLFTAIILHTLLLGFVLRLLLNWLPLTKADRLPFALVWCSVLVLSLAWAFYRDAPSGNWILLFAVAVLVTWEQLHRKFSKVAGAYSSIFLLNILSASIGAAALYDVYTVQLREEKHQLASQLLRDRDEISEYLLAKAAESIQKDVILIHTLRAPWVNGQFLDRKIRRQHLQSLSDAYTVKVRLFDVNGLQLYPKDSLMTWQGFVAAWVPQAKATTQKGQSIKPSAEEPGKFTYLQEIKLALNPYQWVTVLLELSPKVSAPNSVLPELLVNSQSAQVEAIPSGGYAIWRNGRWLKTSGLFEYGQYFSPTLMKTPQLYSQGISAADYHHLAAESPNGTVAIVSTLDYGFRSWLSNFSLLFLVHTLALFTILGSLVLSKGRLVKTITSTFSTKIQLFLNMGVLVPLVLVSLTIGSLVTDSYRQDLVRGYIEQGEFVRQNILTSNWGAVLFKGRADSLSRRVNRLADISQAELNIYDAKGQLRISSQPALFEAGVLSTRLNPQAYGVLRQQGLNRVLLDEKAGTLPYRTIYVPLRDKPTDAPKGYLGIPFFDSEKELNSKLIQLITTILNIFTVLFLVFVTLSYAATRALTVPLKLLTERLKRTTLTESNEKLVYESNDEIGLLVREYNHMLQKLEESKQELALREKEAAWKEMARQVAHEIKNPLTPMKLSLQYLRKAMAEGRSNIDELVGKISNTMITQIDVLSDIATSFSNFTSMPDLKMEVLELNELVRRSVDLHLSPQQHQMNLQLPQEPILVRADENQLIRIFNNLLLNALQAVPSGKTPAIHVTVQPDYKGWVTVRIQDNGSGIPEEVQPKIFVPNFSTKYSGSGIGLAVVKKGVEAMGGSIWFETQENVGTTFFLKLPVVQA
ncbi:GHKL domain-containing protein [Nibribacter ruber]|uniref:histidine kinase n=1 Tax=Nibribacter ruber TaxID=2698458 RepID=A0A6P1NVL1_9BACT|nr:HAMP domain-containing sensor histidine kinase [Nibribacter ruber]QHL87090.1 GHKL domain-containing protein [Nibribacter ruber]